MASADKVPMLAEGHRKLDDELRRLKSEERPAIVEAIEAARAHGDLSENAEYRAAKERRGQIEATIADLEDRLSRAMVIDPTTLSGDKVVFGATVTLLDEDGKKVRYQLVGQGEGDGKDGRNHGAAALVWIGAQFAAPEQAAYVLGFVPARFSGLITIAPAVPTFLMP